jgi:hypothetical protein
VDWRWHELETAPPHDVLKVVRIGPEGVESAGRVGCYVSIVANKCAEVLVARVDGMRADGIRRARCNVPNKVVEARVMDVWAQIQAVNIRWWRGTREAGLPRRNVVPAIRPR